MPFNPDDFLAEKQAEVPVGSSPKSFDPDAFLASSGVESQPPSPPSSLESFASGAVQGAMPLGSGSFIDEAVGLVSDKGKDYIRQTESENPIPFISGNIVGAIVSPDPFAKLKAVRSAGILAKLGIAAAGNAADSYLTRIGSAAGSLKERVSKASEDFTENGLWSLATAPLRALGFRQKGSEKVVGKLSELGKDEASAARKLGQELQGPLSEPKAQLELGENVRKFQPDSLTSLKADRDALGVDIDKLANETLSKTPVNILSPLESANNVLRKLKPEELTPQATKAKNFLDETLRGMEETFVKSEDVISAYGNKVSSKTNYNTDFPTVLAQRRKLGEMIWGDNPAFKDQDIKKVASDLYFDMGKSLEKADASGQFANINKGFDATYKLQDVADSLDQPKIVGLADPQSSNYKYVDEIKKIFKAVPEDVKAGRLINSDKAFNEGLPELAIKARVMKQITGRLPGEQSQILNMLGGRLSSIDNFIQGNKLGFINRLASEEMGRAAPITKGSLGIIADTARGSNPALVNLQDGE